jgi:hypothetical protein
VSTKENKAVGERKLKCNEFWRWNDPPKLSCNGWKWPAFEINTLFSHCMWVMPERAQTLDEEILQLRQSLKGIAAGSQTIGTGKKVLPSWKVSHWCITVFISISDLNSKNRGAVMISILWSRTNVYSRNFCNSNVACVVSSYGCSDLLCIWCSYIWCAQPKHSHFPLNSSLIEAISLWIPKDYYVITL